MESNNLLLKIESSIQDLRPSEQKVAKYVQKHAEQVKFQTVSELAANSGVSEASVMRFIKSLGFKGFQYFKLSLATLGTEVNNGIPQVKEITDGNSIHDVKETLSNNCIASIHDTFSMLEKKNLEKAVELISEAKNIFIIGVGASGILAQLLSYNFLRMGLVTKYISDPHLQAMHSSLMGPEDLLISVSHSGSTRDTVDAMRIAHDSGAKTICITGHVKSPIAKFADVLLCTYAREDPLGISQGRSSISQVFVIETLTACIYTQQNQQAVAARQKTAQSVLEKLY